MQPRIIIAFILLLTPTFIAYSADLKLNDIKWPPYFFPRLEANEQPGIAKEILNICLAKHSHTVSYKNLPIKRTHLYMRSGELDISVYSFKPDREKFVVYGKEALFETEYGFASRASDNIEIDNFSDIYKYRFGHLAGLSHTPELMEIIEEKRLSNEVSEGYDLDAMFGQLLATPQRFEIMASAKETLLWRAKQLGISDEIKVHDFIIKVKRYFITVSKSSHNLEDIDLFLTDMDKCIRDLKTSGEYKKILSQYGL